MPHRPLLPGFGSLCDGGPVVCTRIDSFAFNARIDAILLTSTDRRGLGFVAPYGFSIGLFERLEGGIYTDTAVWRQEPAPGESITRWQQGPMRFMAKGLLWPWVKDPHQRFTALLSFEYEARLPRFDGPNQLGLLTDLGVLRGVVNWPTGLAEVGLSVGALFDWQGRYGTEELGARVGLHLPFLPDVKVFAEGLARGFVSRVNSNGLLPGALDPASPIRPSGVLGLGIASRQMRAVDFAMVVHVGFGDTAPFFLTLRFADIAWGKGYPRPQSLVVDAVREFSAWVHEQVASIDPMFNERCVMIDDAPPHGTGRSMNLIGHQTPDGEHCLWNGIWLKKSGNNQRTAYWKNKSSTLLCHDRARDHCFAQRASAKEPWEPIENPVRRALLRGDCIFEDADSKHRLTHFGTLTPDRRSCTDGRNTVPVGQHVAYQPELHQIDLGQQGPHRRGVLAGYKEPTTWQRLGTALGRGIEEGQHENKSAEGRLKAAAAAGDAKMGAALKAAEEMTPAQLMNGIEAAEREAEDELRHAAADPKGTFERALKRIKQGLEDTAETAQEGLEDTAHRIDRAAERTTKEVIDWTEKPALEQAEDVLKLGGRTAATAPRETTTNIATGVVVGAAGKVVSGAVLSEEQERKTAKRLLKAADQKAEQPPGGGPYAHLPPPRTVAPGKSPTAAQKREIRAANRQANEGKLVDDYTGEVLVPPVKSTKGVRPPPNEAQIDHRVPASAGGDNSYGNLRVTSRRYNRSKSDRMPNADEK